MIFAIDANCGSELTVVADSQRSMNIVICSNGCCVTDLNLASEDSSTPNRIFSTKQNVVQTLYISSNSGFSLRQAFKTKPLVYDSRDDCSEHIFSGIQRMRGS